MGKLIISNGLLGKKPYYIKLTNTNVYSIEELCYYIEHNLDIIQEEMFYDPLAGWMGDDLLLTGRAELLLGLIKKGASLKDLVVCILCSCDYHTEVEIKQIISKMDVLAALSPFEKKKRRADNYLQYKKYRKAKQEYEGLLYGEDIILNSVQYGTILHNLAVVKLHTEGPQAAMDDFKEAYDRSGNYASLKQYIQALTLGNREDSIKEAMIQYKLSEEVVEEIQRELTSHSYEDLNDRDVSLVKEILEHKENGRFSEFYHLAEEFISLRKNEFRMENS